MNRDERRGRARNLKGRVKEAWGTVTGNKRTESEGAVDRAGGAIQEGFGKVKRNIGRSLEDTGEDVRRR